MKRSLLLVCYLVSSQLFSQDLIPLAKIETRLGTIYFEFHEETIAHKKSFIELANSNYWDSLTFNRVIPNFVAQGGCPDTEEGFTDASYLLEPEIFPHITHIYGAVGAGRDDNPGKISARCQFYIIHRKEGVHRLDGNYTIFGQVIKGMDVVDAIVNEEKDTTNQPLEDIGLKISIEYWNPEQISLAKKQSL
ncbi:peptidylprolyl isomerase [Mongoliitalea lutea]|uniref:Peptidyl-prolyl cis-trans isomerase n=1 Tax=Mongoliitalea lutea TaxID=849756 RepID=A0A8J3G756_9BACT|nr:peptidylprolyl isomerase [Mongoliitalea lutea]GHB49813.1 hypothetical protein GCM10008106_33300 [Mongoliitalea lutea]